MKPEFKPFLTSLAKTYANISFSRCEASTHYFLCAECDPVLSFVIKTNIGVGFVFVFAFLFSQL